MDESGAYSNTQNLVLTLSDQTSTGVSPLEQEVLDEYERLSSSMKELSSMLAALSSGPITLEIAEGLRLLERKVASVYTLMKASVYSIVLQQGQMEGIGESGTEGSRDAVDNGQG